MMMIVRFSFFLALIGAAFLASCEGSGSSGGGTTVTSLDPPAEPEPPGDQPAFPFVDHVGQSDITAGRILFDELFILGDELFEAAYNTLNASLVRPSAIRQRARRRSIRPSVRSMIFG